MKTEFNKKTTNFGCYSLSKASEYLKNENFTIEDVLNADVKLKDKAWFIRNNCELSDIELREFAIGCALIVLPIYESKYPDNKAPREAIKAAKAYLKNEISLDELNIKRHAAAADAYAADDYADAYAAAAAAAADAYAADAYAAAAAAAASAASTYQDQLLQFFKDFLIK